MNNLIDIHNVTMTSREIADLTGKRHDNVTTDIRNMLKDLELDVSSFGCIYKDSMNRNQTEYRLDRDLTDCLLTGYSAKARMKVIKRWKELESAQPKLPSTYKESLLALVEAEEEKEKQARLNAEFSAF